MNYIITFLIAMIPLVELRGAVPYAISSGIPLWQALLIGVIGNMLPVPIIFFFARHILEWGKDKPVIGNFFTWCLNKGQKLQGIRESFGPYSYSSVFPYQELEPGLEPSPPLF